MLLEKATRAIKVERAVREAPFTWLVVMQRRTRAMRLAASRLYRASLFLNFPALFLSLLYFPKVSLDVWTFILEFRADRRVLIVKPS